MNSFLHLNVDIEWLDVYIGLCPYLFMDILYGVYWSPHCTSFSPTKRFFSTVLYLSVNIQKTFFTEKEGETTCYILLFCEGERIYRACKIALCLNACAESAHPVSSGSAGYRVKRVMFLPKFRTVVSLLLITLAAKPGIYRSFGCVVGLLMVVYFGMALSCSAAV